MRPQLGITNSKRGITRFDWIIPARALSTIAHQTHLALLLLFSALPCGSFAAIPQHVDQNFWVVNGAVYAMAQSGDTLYFGGFFFDVGRYMGSGVPIDSATAAPAPGFPKLNGPVNCVAADGHGGWFVGGRFDSVGGRSRDNLSHIRSDLTLDSWNPASDGPITRLWASGNTVYATGSFSHVGGQARAGFAALDALTGQATAWAPTPNGEISAVGTRNGIIYVGGTFTNIGGTVRNHIAAFDSITGSVTSWDPNSNGDVLAIGVDSQQVYVGGKFGLIGGQPRGFIAALDPSTGQPTGWDPTADSDVLVLTVAGGVVYAGGLFTHMGSGVHERIAAIDAHSGSVSAWSPTLFANSGANGVTNIAASGSTVYAIEPGSSLLAAIDASSGLVLGWHPRPNGFVNALAVGAHMVYLGGSFNSVGGTPRWGAAAVNIRTGQILPWDPHVAGSVSSLAIGNGVVYLGGEFFQVSGVPRNNIAATDVASGAPTAWNPGLGGKVDAIVARNEAVIAGGHTYLVALSSASGTTLGWNPTPNGEVRTLMLSGNTLYVGGDFDRIGGQPRTHLAALDLPSGLATAWNPSPIGSVRSLVRGDAGVIYAGADYQVAAFDSASGGSLWAATLSTIYPNDGANALATTSSTLLAGGGFYQIRDQRRTGLAELNASTGQLTPWDPQAIYEVDAITIIGGDIYVGGPFTSIDRVGLSGLAVFRDLSTPTLLTAFDAEWDGGAIRLSWSFHESNDLVTVERSSRSNGPWTPVVDERRREGSRVTVVDWNVEAGITYWYRLVGSDPSGDPSVFATIQITAGKAVSDLRLAPPSPNPTRSVFRLEFDVPRRCHLRLRLMDVQGRERYRLADGEYETGRHQLVWDATRSDHSLSAGIYFVQIESREESRVQRLLVIP